MNYDITMCRQECKLADTCYRALQYKRYLNDTNQNKKIYVSMYIGATDDDCRIYWEEKRRQE